MLCPSLPHVDLQPKHRELVQACFHTEVFHRLFRWIARRLLDKILCFEKRVLNLKDRIPLGVLEDFRSEGKKSSSYGLARYKETPQFDRKTAHRKSEVGMTQRDEVTVDSLG